MLLNIDRLYHGFVSKANWFFRRPGVYTPVLHDINLSIPQGSFVAIVGASGCGKSTLLKAILGTHPQREGSIRVAGQEVVGPSRDIGIVYQHYPLYGHMTVLKNVMVGPKWDQTSIPYRLFLKPLWWKKKREHKRLASEMLHRVGLTTSLQQYPSRLSGGMKQRVAIAQALMNKPKLLLFDEPLGALDKKIRESLQDLLIELYQQNVQARKAGLPSPYTVVMVTHELSEAFIVADRVIGLSKKWKDPITGQGGDTLGATIVYDKATPIYEPGKVRDYERFAVEEQSLVKVVFEQDGDLVDPSEHQTYWSDLQEGIGSGLSVMAQDGER